MKRTEAAGKLSNDYENQRASMAVLGRVAMQADIAPTVISNLAPSGVHPKLAQTLARHSTITLTMDRYAHVGLPDHAIAIKFLPPIPGATGRATGGPMEASPTGAEDVPSLAPGLYQLGPDLDPTADAECQPPSSIGNDNLQIETEGADCNSLQSENFGTPCRDRSSDVRRQRRRRDSNPRYRDAVHRFSRPALSTTQAPLRKDRVHPLDRPGRRPGRTG